MNVLIIGNGGREHALAWKISQSTHIKKIFTAPGNAGTAQFTDNLPIDTNDFGSVLAQIRNHGIDWVIIGPEAPLAAGLKDFLTIHNIKTIGCTKAAARLESSKCFAKDFMRRHNIPTAEYLATNNKNEALAFLNAHKQKRWVIKADGLAAGKGVFVTQTNEQAIQAVERLMAERIFGDAGRAVVIESFLEGIELSVFVLADGLNYVVLPVAKDYKRAFDYDTGPNTGGMGAVSPLPFVTDEFLHSVENKIIKPTLNGCIEEGFPYSGFLYFGLMKVGTEPFVIEYNVRLGDPEAQVILPRIQTDLIELFNSITKNDNNGLITVSPKYALTLVNASGGYPDNYSTGFEIYRHNQAKQTKNIIEFYAGVKLIDGKEYTSGGRVLAITALADTLEEARNLAYQHNETIYFEKKQFRTDIGADLIKIPL